MEWRQKQGEKYFALKIFALLFVSFAIIMANRLNNSRRKLVNYQSREFAERCLGLMKRSICIFILAILLPGSVVYSINADTVQTNLPPKKQILFICTGNYYRSRFAEALFNQQAAKAHLEWRAVSRGLQLTSSQHGISYYARQELIKRGVPQELCKGEPRALTKADLEKSDYVVLMDEAEHRPMLEKQFPVRDNHKIHYWHIAESGKSSIPKACQTMSTDVQQLFQTLEH